MLDERRRVAIRSGAEAKPASGEALTALLNHVACELAEEYVRLMEAAAGGESLDTYSSPTTAAELP